MTHLTITGQHLELLPERAVFWAEAATLLIADPHFGKAATFRRAGLPVPRGTTTEAIARLDAALAATRAERIIVLGDLLHAREGREEETLRRLAEWRARIRGVEMVLVRGNHDRHAGDPPPALGIDCRDAPLLEGPFAFTHHPTEVTGRYVFAGHLHPSVRLIGPGAARARLPCFWFGERRAVLPAFGDFTGSAPVRPAAGDQVWVVADDVMLRVR